MQMGRLFQVAVDPVSFDVRGVLTEPAMMPRFTEALVGKRYYVLFSMNFLACGQTWGDPPVEARYLPVLRFDPDSLTYTVNPPPDRILRSNQVIGSDVAAGRFGRVRYAQWSGSCLTQGADQGYIITFLLTVAGRYNVWVYTDTENSRIVAGSPKVRRWAVHCACRCCFFMHDSCRFLAQSLALLWMASARQKAGAWATLHCRCSPGDCLAEAATTRKFSQFAA